LAFHATRQTVDLNRADPRSPISGCRVRARPPDSTGRAYRPGRAGPPRVLSPVLASPPCAGRDCGPIDAYRHAPPRATSALTPVRGEIG
jgi:hypothetical protein